MVTGKGEEQHINEEAIQNAVNILLDYDKQQRGGKNKQKRSLIQYKDSVLYVVVGLQTPLLSQSQKPRRIAIPFPFLLRSDGSSDVCLFVKDTDLNYLQNKLIGNPSLPNLKCLVSVSQLRTSYKRIEQRKLLASSFDFFLADDRITPLLTNLLGKVFVDKRKMPITVQVDNKFAAQSINKALQCTYFTFRKGPLVAIKTARTTMPKDEIIANVKAVCDGIVQKIPSQWRNITSISLKLKQSSEIPIYMTRPVVVRQLNGKQEQEKELIKNKETNEKKQSEPTKKTNEANTNTNVDKKRKASQAEIEKNPAPSNKKAKQTKSESSESKDSNIAVQIPISLIKRPKEELIFKCLFKAVKSMPLIKNSNFSKVKSIYSLEPIEKADYDELL